MTGGMGFVYDTNDNFGDNLNCDTVLPHRIQSSHWGQVLRDLVAEHWVETQSRFSERLLVDWDREIRRFWQVVPIEMIDKLEHPVLEAVDEEQRA